MFKWSVIILLLLILLNTCGHEHSRTLLEKQIVQELCEWRGTCEVIK